jgi:pimeloyl-ACP methyl ester carboxylesterase
VPYELPEDPSAARRATIWRWVSLLLVALLVALLAYLAYIGFDGSGQVAQPPAPSRDCRTPAVAFDWAYEAINYDAATDAELAELPDPADCPQQGAPAGTDLQTSDGRSIAGWYIPAASAVGPEGPTVVLAHGHGSNKSGMLSQAQALHDEYNLVMFDFRNHGQSEAAPTTVGVTEQADIRAVVDWLEQTKGPTAIALLGESMGGATAISAAVGDPRIDAVILDSTHATLANALQQRLERAGYPLSLPGAWAILLGGLIRTGQDMSSADPVQAIERFERPVLIISAGLDDALGPTDADQLLAAAREGGSDAELKVCAGAQHGAAAVECPADYSEWVVDFLQRSLPSPS